MLTSLTLGATSVHSGHRVQWGAFLGYFTSKHKQDIDHIYFKWSKLFSWTQTTLFEYQNCDIIISGVIQMLNKIPCILEYDSWDVLASSALSENISWKRQKLKLEIWKLKLYFYITPDSLWTQSNIKTNNNKELCAVCTLCFIWLLQFW